MWTSPSTLLVLDPSDGKSMPAAEAPIAWSEGRYREVMDYCIQDCRLTARVWQGRGFDGIVPGRRPQAGAEASAKGRDLER